MLKNVMHLSPCALAEDASFNAFMNCYLREVDAGKWFSCESWCEQNHTTLNFKGKDLIEIHLPFSHTRIVMDVIYRSSVGRHHFDGIYIQSSFTQKAPFTQSNAQAGAWQKADLMFVLFLVVREIYQLQTQRAQENQRRSMYSDDGYCDTIKKNEMQLLARLIDSYQLMVHYIEMRSDLYSNTSKDILNFIDSEQLALYGHWLHPTPKSRQGMSWWQQAHYSPELQGSFQLHYFAVDKNLVSQGSILPLQASDIIYAELKKVTPLDLDAKKIPIPVHPLQAQFLLLQAPIKDLLRSGGIKDLGRLGAEYTPTSSVRTVFNADSDWMFKFSIPVRITNSLRNNRKHELKVGPVIEKFMRKSGFLEKHTAFRIIEDPAYITLNIPGIEETGFEVILRRNVFRQNQGAGICSILALVQAPVNLTNSEDGVLQNSLLKQIIQRLAAEEHRPASEVALTWFKRYWGCAIESLIWLYDTHGIALEAHQQNSLLDVCQGYPNCFYYRDNQGFYLSNAYRESLAKIEPEILTITHMFYDDRVTFEGISYYMFINQLFSVIYRLGADDLVEEGHLIEQVKNALKSLHRQLTGIGKQFVAHLLNERQLSYKTNLLARVHDIDELHEGMERAVYATMPNPLFSPLISEGELNDSPLQENVTVNCHVA